MGWPIPWPGPAKLYGQRRADPNAGQLYSLPRMSEAASQSPSEQRFQALGRLLRLTMSLSKGIYSFSDWKVMVDPDHPRRYRVEVTDAEHLPEVIAVGALGFLNECSCEARPERISIIGGWRLRARPVQGPFSLGSEYGSYVKSTRGWPSGSYWRASARLLMEAGLYQQLSFLSRWEETATRERNEESARIADFARNFRTVISLAQAIYNVGKWTVEPDPERPGRVVLEAREASAYSEPMRLAIEAFLNECARAAREDLAQLFASERPAPDLIVLRMTRDITDLRRG